jgi:hypothetical protein
MAKLLAKGNFKRLTVCDEFNKIQSNRSQIKLKVTPNETWNWYSKLIHLVEVHLFYVEHMFKQIMVVFFLNQYHIYL